MQIDKIIKREVISLVVSIVLILIIFIGVSFSSFFSVAEGETSQISFGDIELTLCEDTSCDPSFTNYGKTIGLDTDGPQATPIPIYPYETTADALSTVPYIFNLSNTGSLDVYVNLYLEEAESPELSGNYSSYTRTALLHANNIKIGLNECNGGSINTTNVSVYTYGNLDNNKILSNKKLNVDEDITYCMWVWLDGNTPNDVQSTYFIADLRGTAEYKPSEWYYNALTLSKYPNYLTTKMLTSETPYADNVSSPNVTTATGINFGAISSSTNGQGLYYTTDENDTQDGSRVYYYRGNIDNNHVLFAGFCWRIIRTNEDGSVRMRYNGTPNAEGACPQAGTNVSLGNSTFNSSNNNNKYVGYMYGSTCTNISSYATCHANENNSVIKTFVDNWYQANIGANPIFNSKVDESSFCNDRSLNYGTGVGETTTFYNGNTRRGSDGNMPTYKCMQQNDIFKVKAGLLTLDEMRFAGAINSSNTSYYLHTSGWSWTMTPSDYSDQSGVAARVHYQNGSGAVYANSTTSEYGVLPVISLKYDTEVSSGTGERSNPWRVSNELLARMIESKAYPDNVSSPNVTASTGINFAEVSSDTNGKGLYYTTDANDTQDGSRVYYYRGNVENNHVIFAGFCWRIIRSNEDGSVRMRYNGTPTDGSCLPAGNEIHTHIYPTYIKNGNTISGQNVLFNIQSDDNRYVGYMYGNDCNSYEMCHANQNNSTIKTFVDEWYEYAIDSNEDYDNMVATSNFCNDRSLSSGTGFNQTDTTYSPYNRRGGGIPTYKCSQSNDILRLKVGLLTLDEARFVGGRGGAGVPNGFLCYLNTGGKYWTMTPSQYVRSGSSLLGNRMNYVSNTGAIWAEPGNSINLGNYAALPVISLKADIQVSSGEGSSSNPWMIN